MVIVPADFAAFMSTRNVESPSVFFATWSAGVVRASKSIRSECSARDVREIPLESNGHTHGPQAVVLTLDRAIDWTAFGIWLTMLLHARGGEILRIKGLLDVGGAGPLLVNCVQHAVYPPVHLDAWPDEDHCSRLVVIGHDVDRNALEWSLLAFDGVAV